MQVTKIEGRVAQVLDERQLVINRGDIDGVSSGMKFEILSESPLPITDPDTGQVLDELDRIKARVVVTEVRERISICSTYEQRIVRGHNSILEMFAPAHRVPVTLSVEEAETPPVLDPEQSFVRRGDRAVQLVDPGSG